MTYVYASKVLDRGKCKYPKGANGAGAIGLFACFLGVLVNPFFFFFFFFLFFFFFFFFFFFCGFVDEIFD